MQSPLMPNARVTLQRRTLPLFAALLGGCLSSCKTSTMPSAAGPQTMIQPVRVQLRRDPMRPEDILDSIECINPSVVAHFWSADAPGAPETRYSLAHYCCGGPLPVPDGRLFSIDFGKRLNERAIEAIQQYIHRLASRPQSELGAIRGSTVVAGTEQFRLAISKMSADRSSDLILMVLFEISNATRRLPMAIPANEYLISVIESIAVSRHRNQLRPIQSFPDVVLLKGKIAEIESALLDRTEALVWRILELFEPSTHK